MKKTAPFILVQDAVSNDTVTALEQLLDEARRGGVIGIAYVAMLNRRGFITNSAGEAHRSPTFARGMVAALDDYLAQRIRGTPP